MSAEDTKRSKRWRDLRWKRLREGLCYICGASLKQAVSQWAKWNPTGCSPDHEQEILHLLVSSPGTDPVLESWRLREDAFAEKGGGDD